MWHRMLLETSITTDGYSTLPVSFTLRAFIVKVNIHEVDNICVLLLVSFISCL